MAAKSIDWVHMDLQPQGAGVVGNGSQVFTASMLTVLQLISLSVGLAAGTQVYMRGFASESTSGTAFQSLYLVAFGRDRERRRSRCYTHGALIQSMNSA